MVGIYKCLPFESKNATVLVQLPESVTVQPSYPLPVGSTLCSCKRCQQRVTILSVSHPFPIWAWWDYGGNNTFSMRVFDNNIVLSSINVSLAAFDANPHITTLVPALSPTLIASGYVDVHADNYLSSDLLDYQCKFLDGNSLVLQKQAVRMNTTVFRCPLPQIPEPAELTFTLYPNTDEFGQGLAFQNVSFPYPFYGI